MYRIPTHRITSYLILLGQVGGALFCIELLIMLFLSNILDFDSAVLEALVDAGLLTLFSTPLCFYLLLQALKSTNQVELEDSQGSSWRAILRVFALPFLIVLTVITAFIFSFYYSERSQFSVQQKTLGERAVNIPAQIIREELNDAVKDLQTLANSIQHGAADKVRMQKLVQEFAQVHGDFLQVMWLGPEDTQFRQPGNDGALLGKVSKQGLQLYELQLQASDQEVQAILPLGIPMADEQGRDLGTLIALYGFQHLLSHLSLTTDVEQYELYLLDASAAWGIRLNDKSPQVLRLEEALDLLDSDPAFLQVLQKGDKAALRQNGIWCFVQPIPLHHVMSLAETPDSQRGQWSLVLRQSREIHDHFQNQLFFRTLVLYLGLAGLLFAIFVMLITGWLKREAGRKLLVQARDQAQRATKVKSEFLANMSHEIRTPMNAILGFSEILYPRVQNPEEKEFVKSIISSGKTLLRLINDILDLSKIEADRMVLEYSIVNLKNLAHEVGQIFSQKISAKGLDFELEVQAGLPPALLVDEIRLRQILINLLGNAVKFTEKGYLKIKLFYHQPPGVQLLDLGITVEDTGIGIPPDQQERIFEAFEQRSGQSHTKYGGTGLGLTICKKLAAMMGGDLYLKSEEGKGSAFTLMLPGVEIASPAAPSQAIPDELGEIIFEPATILVADDIPLNRKLIKEMLQPHPQLKILEANDGDEALAQALAHRPVLVLLDIKMPGKTGHEVALHLTKTLGKQVPVLVAVTASVTSDDQAELTPDFQAVLTKPLMLKDLLHTLAGFLSHHQLPSPTAQVEEALPSFTPGDRVRFQGLVVTLRKEAWPDWEEVSQTAVIDKIEHFAQAVALLAAQAGYRPLETWAQLCLEKAKNFDLEALSSNLQRFPHLFEQLIEDSRVV